MGAMPSISIAIVGSGGTGALTTGNFLFEAASAAGWQGIFIRTLGPQIRGGEAAALLRFAVDPVESPPDHYDLLIGVDWLNAHRFGSEIKVAPNSLVIGDPRGGDVPPIVAQSGARVIEIPMKELAKGVKDGRPNMVALGIAARLLGFTAEQLFTPVEKRLADKGKGAIESSRAAIKIGFEAVSGLKFDNKLPPPKPSKAKRWLLSGNEASALGAIRARNGNRTVPYYAHPGMFCSRAMRLPNGDLRYMDDVPSIADLTTQGANVICTTEPQSFLDDLFYVSGEIPRVTPFERGLPGQVRKTEDGSGWEPDELLMDERWLAVNVKGKGLVVLSACSHAGIVNVLEHARNSFADTPLHAVVGGLHLSGANEAIIPQTVSAMGEFKLAQIAAGHCTGWRAISELAAAFGDKALVPTAVGKRYTF